MVRCTYAWRRPWNYCLQAFFPLKNFTHYNYIARNHWLWLVYLLWEVFRSKNWNSLVHREWFWSLINACLNDSNHFNWFWIQVVQLLSQICFIIIWNLNTFQLLTQTLNTGNIIITLHRLILFFCFQIKCCLLWQFIIIH